MQEPLIPKNRNPLKPPLSPSLAHHPLLCTGAPPISDPISPGKSEMGSLPAVIVTADAAGDSRRLITSAELSLHTTPGDLWIAIQGKVYDVTAWTKHHPGGAQPLLSLSGQDVTDAFVAYHPGYAWSLLDRFLIGHLSDPAASAVSRDYRRLVADFSKLGLFDKKSHTTAFTLLAVTLLFAASVYLVLATTSPFAHLAAGCFMGMLWIQSGWLGHDSGHSTIMATKPLNRIAQILTGNCLAGISIAWWKWNHNAHHIACNSLDYDPDLQHIPFFAVASPIFHSITSYVYERKMTFDAASRFLVSYQHWTFYPVMCFARLNLWAQSFILLLTKKNVQHRWGEIVGMAVFWIWFPLLVSCLPNWGERVMFVIASFAVTGIQHVQFCLNHFSSSVYLGKPQGNDWFEKQTEGTLNIVCHPWMDWFHGGLQYQVEHHLFPRLPRCHLRTISPIIKDYCKKHNLTYATASFLEANKMTIRTLRTAALQARELGNLVPKNLVWEAVNTHG